MLASLKSSALYQQFDQRFSEFSPRDQLAIKVLAAFFAIIILVYGVLVPASQYQQDAQAHYRSSLESYRWMQANQGAFAQASQQRSQRDPGQSLLGIANKTSKSYQLSFKRYQPVGEAGLSLWLDNVSFNSLVMWLERLDKKYGISVSEIAVERQPDKGLVNVRLVLQG
ncbi:type II secretion system protein GspM [Oceanicoccus sagamiensis]|uniref:Type II secretion system protein M n=1 Tax=Oceanicoccus sagamiensis TaxID=716816 RepID=A0A1X9NC43_9GAMM|nr:type II secretion system protein M [Oceanicoccus sagamiensis]ARN75600.1 hypothetical protein BST96_16700 [Oceanicoccus sagamiensis]